MNIYQKTYDQEFSEEEKRDAEACVNYRYWTTVYRVRFGKLSASMSALADGMKPWDEMSTLERISKMTSRRAEAKRKSGETGFCSGSPRLR